MPDAQPLAHAAPHDLRSPAVATDIVLITQDGQRLKVLLITRAAPPARGRPALPGVRVGIDEDIDHAARRALSEKVGLDAPVRQFHAFGSPRRDPRARIVSIGYAALLPLRTIRPVLNERRQLVQLRDGVCRADNGRRLTLPFDHADIIAAAFADLRAHLDSTTWAFGLLPEEFSLRELQQVHEAVRGETLNKPSFRKRMLDSGRLQPTGRHEADTRFRPAELYRLREEHARER